MAINLFTFVGMFDKALATADHVLARGAEHAAAGGVGEAEMLGWRLIADMQPLAFQIATVATFGRNWPARAAGLPIPEDFPERHDVAGLRADLAAARAYLATLTPAQFEGRDDAPVTFNIGGAMELTLPAGQWLAGFANTNLFFHLSIAYAILRARGVPLGKRDMFAAGL